MTNILQFRCSRVTGDKHLDNCMAIIETSLGHMMIAALIGAGSLLIASTAPESGALPEAQRLIGICISGGIGGGLIAVILFPLSTVRQTGLKWLASSAAAGLFGPASCLYLKIEENIFYSLAMAGFIGLTAWGILLILIPLSGDSAKRALKKWLPSIFGQMGEDVLHSRRRRPGDWIEGSESEDGENGDGKEGKPNEFGSSRR